MPLEIVGEHDSFSRLHTTAYTMIALQELTLFHNYPQVIWNTAVLIVNSASVEEVIDPSFIEPEYDDEGNLIEVKKASDTVDYGMIATSIGEIRAAGIEVSPPHVNSAKKQFQADIENNRILYSLKGLSGVGEKEIDLIIENRPFSSLNDFLEKAKVKKPTVVSLIKSGAFDELENRDRVEIMKDYILSISEPKKRITLQNFRGLIQKDMIPQELSHTKALFEFNRYIRQKQFKKDGKLFIDERAQKYLEKNYEEFYSEAQLEEDNLLSISEARWKKLAYDKGMDDARSWMKDHQQELLDLLNQKLFEEVWDKYCLGNISKWEMDSMSYYTEKHELAYADLVKYGIKDFKNLPEIPVIDYVFRPDGVKSIPIFELTKIVGTCIDKDNMKNTFTILTPDGSVVSIRLNNEHYAYYNKQLSQFNPQTNKKKVVEKSWFSRGNKVMVVGFRRDQAFVPKRYSRTPEQHRIYLITDIEENGDLKLASERWSED